MGKVQYLPSLYTRRNQMMAAKRMVGDSTKKSPCFAAHDRLRLSMMLYELS